MAEIHTLSLPKGQEDHLEALSKLVEISHRSEFVTVLLLELPIIGLSAKETIFKNLGWIL